MQMAMAYDNDRPYRLVINVIRGTNSGRALKMMANGTVVVYPTLREALDAKDRYEDAAKAVLDSCDPVCFGVILVVDLRNGAVHYSGPLLGKAGK